MQHFNDEDAIFGLHPEIVEVLRLCNCAQCGMVLQGFPVMTGRIEILWARVNERPYCRLCFFDLRRLYAGSRWLQVLEGDDPSWDDAVRWWEER